MQSAKAGLTRVKQKLQNKEEKMFFRFFVPGKINTNRINSKGNYQTTEITLEFLIFSSFVIKGRSN